MRQFKFTPPGNLASQFTTHRLQRLAWAMDAIAERMGPETHAEVQAMLYGDLECEERHKGRPQLVGRSPNSVPETTRHDKAAKWLADATSPAALAEAKLKVRALGLDPERILAGDGGGEEEAEEGGDLTLDTTEAQDPAPADDAQPETVPPETVPPTSKKSKRR
jgi:hypothetical protein